MGVPVFFRWLMTRYPKIVTSCGTASAFGSSKLNIDCLYIDMNGIIHPCCHPEDKSKTPATEYEMFQAIVKYLESLLSVARPRELLYLAIDGPAPRAKLNQQRCRRYESSYNAAHENEAYNQIKEEFIADGKAIPEKEDIWDSNAITPGTEFMECLCDFLRNWIHLYTAKISSAEQPLLVIFSDVNAPGEGEHKIMNFIRAQKTYPNYDPNRVHCVYGNDADLIMLGLVMHEPNFYILREVVPDKQALESIQQLNEIEGHAVAQERQIKYMQQELIELDFWLVDLFILRQYLKTLFNVPNDSNKLEECIDDFVFMSFLVGNDFLPHLPSLTIMNGSLDQIILLYQKIQTSIPGGLTHEGKLKFKNICYFSNFLADIEDEVFKNQYRFKERMKAMREAEENESKKEASGFASNNMEDDKGFMEDNSSIPSNRRIKKQSREKDIDEFKEKYRNLIKERCEKIISKTQSNYTLGVGNPQSYRLNYYMDKFKLTDDDKTDIEKFIERVAKEYTIGLAWVFTYYYSGVPSWSWYYPYYYAPLASDLVKYGLDRKCLSSWEVDEPLNPLDHLMLVLPPGSGDLLPKSYSTLMHPSIKHPPSLQCFDFFPTDFAEDPNDHKQNWLWIRLLPFVDSHRLREVTQNVQPQLTEKEKERNTFGFDTIIFSYLHPLHNEIKSFVSQTTSKNKPIRSDSWAEYNEMLSMENVDISGNSSVNGVFKLSVISYELCHENEDMKTFEFGFYSPSRKPHCSQISSQAKIRILDQVLEQAPNSAHRYNAKAAKRIILGVLRKYNKLTDSEANAACLDTDNNFTGHRSFRQQFSSHTSQDSFVSVNPYQREMFSRRPSYAVEWRSSNRNNPPNNEHVQWVGTGGQHRRPSQHYQHRQPSQVGQWRHTSEIYQHRYPSQNYHRRYPNQNDQHYRQYQPGSYDSYSSSQKTFHENYHDHSLRPGLGTYDNYRISDQAKGNRPKLQRPKNSSNEHSNAAQNPVKWQRKE